MAAGDIVSFRFNIEVDPNDPAKQDSALQVVKTTLLTATNADILSVTHTDTGAGSGKGTARKLAYVIIARLLT